MSSSGECFGVSNEEDLTKDIQRYLSLPYRRVGYPTGVPGNKAYFMEIMELEGCYAEGADHTAAHDALTEELSIWIRMCLENGNEPPLPLAITKKYSGNIHLRMPISLHCKLAMRAKEESVSLNHLIISELSQSAGKHA